MILWRVSNHTALDGAGGLRTPGRWHTRGRRVLYCAPNPATALLEVLVHAEIDWADIPVNLRYLEIEAPDKVAIESVEAGALGASWQLNIEKTRAFGDAWLLSGRTALLRVPSMVVPATWNVVVNPRHIDSAQIRIVRVHNQAVDARLLR